MRRDLATYSARNHLVAADYSELLPATIDESSGCAAADWQPEQALDLEAAHAVAPKAELALRRCERLRPGFDVATSRVLDGGLASIVSNSWGATALDTLAGSSTAATRQSMVVKLHQELQAAGQGVGLYFASGDSATSASTSASTAVDFPASSPLVTAVGGVAAGLDRSGSRLRDPVGRSVALLCGSKKQTWSPKLPGEFLGGAGGGASSLFKAPGVPGRGRARLALAHGMRAATDVVGARRANDRVPGRLPTERPVRGLPHHRGRRHLARDPDRRRPGRAGAAGDRPPARVPEPGAVRGREGVAAASATWCRLDPARGRRSGPASVDGAVTVDRDGTLTARKGYDLPTGLGELTAPPSPRSAASDLSRMGLT